MRSRASTSRFVDFVHNPIEHAPQSRKTSRIPFEERVKNRFRVAVGVKAMAERFQFAPQFQVVIDLAVEHDGDIGIVRQNRLVAVTEVDNLEPRRAHRAQARLEHTLLVRAAMNQRGRCAPNAIGIRHPIFVGESNDSTHARAPLSLS